MNETNPLEEISRKIDALDKREITGIIERGDLLQQAKHLLGAHGGWLQWLKTRHAMPERTAQRYMQTAKFAKNATVADFSTCTLTANALYLLSEDRFWKKAGVGENSRRAATEEVLKAAATQKVSEKLAREIINKALGKSESQKAAKPNNLLLAVFDETIGRLKKLLAKPPSTFADTSYTADDLHHLAEQFPDFLRAVAHLRKMEKAA
jgi:hypothetical protein